MKPNQPSKTDPQPFTTAEKILAGSTALFLLASLLVFGWYGSTFLHVRQTSEIHARDLVISSGDQSCTLSIPAGKLRISRPTQAVIGANSKLDARVELDEPLRFINCTGMPNWNILLEAQTSLIGANVKPNASIRQPVFDRLEFSYNWVFTPEEAVETYQSHLWLRAVVTEKDKTIENWNILIREFPMKNTALFGQPAIIWLFGAGFSLLLGSLLLVLLLQKRGQDRGQDRKN